MHAPCRAPSPWATAEAPGSPTPACKHGPAPTGATAPCNSDPKPDPGSGLNTTTPDPPAPRREAAVRSGLQLHPASLPTLGNTFQPRAHLRRGARPWSGPAWPPRGTWRPASRACGNCAHCLVLTMLMAYDRRCTCWRSCALSGFESVDGLDGRVLLGSKKGESPGPQPLDAASGPTRLLPEATWRLPETGRLAWPLPPAAAWLLLVGRLLRAAGSGRRKRLRLVAAQQPNARLLV